MNIHEYQAKEILRARGVPVPYGQVIESPSQIESVIDFMDAKVLVVKAQIHAGGRGKAGGVKVTHSKQEAIERAKAMFGKILVTHQTGFDGQEVRKVYVEEGSDIKKEYYLSLVVDRASSRIVIIASAEGGMDIEEVAKSHPDAIKNIVIDPIIGCSDFYSRKLGFAIGLSGVEIAKFCKFVAGLYKVFVELDASQIEINPLIVHGNGEFLALDAKFNFDDNALFKHQDIASLRDMNEEDPLEVRASEHSLNYVRMNGEIGCMVNGAGLAMATMDIIQLYGKAPANFLDVGGGATKERVSEAFKIILSDKNVKAILVNIFGGIMRCDIIAEGIVAAAKEINLSVPLVVRLAGTNFEQGKQILENSGLKIISATDLADAASKVVKTVN